MANSNPEIEQLIESGFAPAVARDIVGIIDALAAQASRLGYASGRIGRMSEAAEKLRPTDKIIADDMLRAAVVLLHASLEDFLRTVAAAYLRFAPASVINDVPLVGVGRERPEKFFLGALVEHQHLTVAELIDSSIHAHLERKSFSNSKEIAALLTNLDFKLDDVRHLFAVLDQLSERRHLIVHRCDFKSTTAKTMDLELSQIESSEVSNWANAVNEFGRVVTRKLTLKHLKRHVAFKE